MEIAAYSIALLAGYLLGSIPTGYWLGLMKGVDIRRVGSGNIGATNVFRALGKTAGIFVLVVDALKGYAACRLVAPLAARMLDGAGAHAEYLVIVAGIAAILGHNYTFWLRFQGGKGVATTAGVLLGLSPGGFLLSLGVWVAVFAASRYVSLASIAAAVALPIAVWLSDGSPTLIVVFAIVGILAIFKHRSNIQRLMAGTENRFGAKQKPGPPSPS